MIQQSSSSRIRSRILISSALQKKRKGVVTNLTVNFISCANSVKKALAAVKFDAQKE